MTIHGDDKDLLEIGLQGMTDNAQLAVAVAIGIFGILGILVGQKHSEILDFGSCL